MGNRCERITTKKDSGKQIPFSGHDPAEVYDFARMEFIDMLKKITQEMNSGDNFDIIDFIVGKDGASVELADDIEYFIKKLGNKNIVVNSSSVDFIRNVSSNMMALVGKIIRKAHEGGLPHEKFEEYAKDIKDDYDALKKYFNLMEKDKDFQSLEIGSRKGYIAHINPKNIDITSKDRKKYVDWLENYLSKNKN
ncbi:MAG: hypothetical protein WC671_01565 [Candidatus Paceibacterota bacterium]|jgi:hypothetical protein